MFDILFKCEQCKTHLSASAEDVGFEFCCPVCDNILAVPAGDVLFSCPACQKSLLASAASIGDCYRCPACEASLTIPQQGRTVSIKETPVVHADAENPPEPSSSQDSGGIPDDEKNNRAEQHMLRNWGAFMAESGLAEEQKEDEDQ